MNSFQALLLRAQIVVSVIFKLKLDHGTHVAGIAAGNALNMSGVAKGAKLSAIQIYTVLPSLFDFKTCGPSCFAAFDSDVLAALRWLYTSQPSTPSLSVINLSFGRDNFTSVCGFNNLFAH